MTDKFIGVQLGSHSVFDEGAEHCLDVLQNEGGINAVFPYAQMYHHGFALNRSLGALAPDHGVPVKDPATRNPTNLWFTPHDEYYEGTFLRNIRFPTWTEYQGRDVLDELMEPAHRRGMKVCARILEASGPDLARLVPNWPKVLTIDIYGRPYYRPCWNNPDYRNWWISTAEDLFKSYPLDGFKYGSERDGPLSGVLFGSWLGIHVPTCFCEHCRARGRAKGIDAESARQGFQEIYELITGLNQGKEPPRDGVLVTLLRILLRHPEVLAWDREWYLAKEEIPKLMYGTIKLIRPEAQVGWHVHHGATSWDFLYRAQLDYRDMIPYSDWLKPVVYHDVAGPRLRGFIAKQHQDIFSELSEELELGLLYALMGLDPEVEPALDELPEKGLGPDYVYRETKRCVDAVGDRIPVYPGLGFDIPHGSDHFYSDPETTYQATLKAFEAGAKGLIVSREYDEMRVYNLRAVKRAVEDADAAGL